jgi:hypothetical protein
MIQMDAVDAIAVAVVVDVVVASRTLMAQTQAAQKRAQMLQMNPAKILQKVQLIAVAVAVVQLAKV